MRIRLSIILATSIVYGTCTQCTFKKQKDYGVWQAMDSLQRFELCQSDGVGKDFCVSMGERGEVLWVPKGQAKTWLIYDKQLRISEWDMTKVTLVDPATPVVRLSFFKVPIHRAKKNPEGAETFYLGRLSDISSGATLVKSSAHFDCIAKGIAQLRLSPDSGSKAFRDCAEFQFMPDKSERLASRSLRNTTLDRIRVMTVDNRSAPNYVGLRAPECLTFKANKLSFHPCQAQEDLDSSQIFTMMQEYDRITVKQGDKVLRLVNDGGLTDVNDFRWAFKMAASALFSTERDSLHLSANFPYDRISPDRQFTFIAYLDQGIKLKEKHFRCLSFSEDGRLTSHFHNFTAEEVQSCVRLSFEPVIGLD